MAVQIGDLSLEPTPEKVVVLVDALLAKAMEAVASDIHLEPTAKELVVRYRLDGVLQEVCTLPKAIAENVIARLKVLGGLLTYRNDLSQEGRIEVPN
jgi:type II secretory ATPase GspE/PulE/Tfp pilus assembly ATPase PilB-like protein